MGPYRVRKRSIYLGPDLDSAVNDHLAATGTEFNALVRTAIAKEIGRPELAESVKMGRPSAPPATTRKKTATKPATPAKKSRTKAGK